MFGGHHMTTKDDLTQDQREALDELDLRRWKAESAQEWADICLREAEIMGRIEPKDPH